MTVWFPEDIVGREVHGAETSVHVGLPSLASTGSFQWRLNATLRIRSYWLPVVQCLLHRFEINVAVEEHGPRTWEDWQTSDATDAHPVRRMADVLLRAEFGGERTNYAVIHLFSDNSNNLGQAAQRAVLAHDSLVTRMRRALDEETLAGAARVTAPEASEGE